MSCSLTRPASESVDKFNEQCLPQAHALRTQPALSSKHRGPASPVKFISCLPFYVQALSPYGLKPTAPGLGKKAALPLAAWAPALLSLPSI